MVLDKSAVLDIIMTYYEKDVEIEAAISVMELESYELEDYFEPTVDYADLESVRNIDVEEFKEEKEKNSLCVSGVLCAVANLNGYVHCDGEDVFVGSSEMSMEFMFQFEIQDGEYMDFEVNYIF